MVVIEENKTIEVVHNNKKCNQKIIISFYFWVTSSERIITH